MNKNTLEKPIDLTQQPPRRFRPFRFLLHLLALLVIAGGAAFGYMYAANKGFRQALNGVVTGADPVRAFGGRQAVTLMLLGKDEDRNNRDQVLRTNARSDTIILARLDFASKTIQMLSIPRDTRVRIPGVRGYSKVNAAHAIGGPDLAARTLQGLLGVEPDAILVVDYEMLCKVIDDLGGVSVNVDRELNYDDNWGNLHIHLKPGVQTLGGRDAMGFVRFRHSDDGPADTDIVRISRQQQLVQAVKARLHEPSTWVRIPGLLETVRKEMQGTLKYPQLVALANFARSVPKANVQMHVLPTRMGRSFVYPDRDAVRVMVARIFPNSSLPDWAQGRDGDTGRRRRRRPRSHVAAKAAAAAVESPAAVTDASPQPAGDAAAVQEVPAVTAAPDPAPPAAAPAAPAPEAPAEPKPNEKG
ncbi:MAG TPA: LCP family protein [Armatimonadota bacterium]